MKARILKRESGMYLYLCNGVSKEVDIKGIRHFLNIYTDENIYIRKPEDIANKVSYAIDSIVGETLVYVDDNGVLCFTEPILFKKLLNQKEIGLLTVTEYSEKHNKNPESIRRYCRQGRIIGALRKGQTWYIPEEASCPDDLRTVKRI